jgi:hypothetical protein
VSVAETRPTFDRVLSGIPTGWPRPAAPGRCGWALGRRGRSPVVCGAPATVVGRQMDAICLRHATALLGYRWREGAVREGAYWYLPAYFEWARGGHGS